VIQKDNAEVLIKQIAGAVAKRIVNYLHIGDKVKQNEELGFIKFGSRVDLLLPLNTRIKVKLNETVKGGVSVIAEL
ncbi:MAG TPA: phosphatidylserine decarboxylase family protein, partial [Chitinophagaceae bacterium]|nr:phosphatidylserine decarboxylase family protein [Chitinophagaceae bacterium]